jgi:hypothetical protein
MNTSIHETGEILAARTKNQESPLNNYDENAKTMTKINTSAQAAPSPSNTSTTYRSKASRYQQMTVDLPNLIPTVTLPLRLAKVLKLLIEAEERTINTIELGAAGCINSANAISKLRKLGARIEKKLKPAMDSHGDTHPRVAHYCYLGWDIDAKWSPSGESV